MSASTAVRSLRRMVEVPVVSPGGGFDRAASLNAGLVGDGLDPFVDLTLFDMSQPVFRPHPHAGFSAVTYLRESSPGTFRNRWTAGPDELIGPGAVHWTRAGSGMMHEEVPTEPGLSCLGVQMFVKLPAARELDPPQAFHLDREQVREVQPAPGVRVRLLAGELDGTSSGLGLPDEVLYFDVHLTAGARVDLPVPADWNAFAYLLDGEADLGGGPVVGPAGATYDLDGDVVRLEALADANLLFCAGRPTGSFVARGSFIMSVPERLDDAERRFRAGEMGRLHPSF